MHSPHHLGESSPLGFPPVENNFNISRDVFFKDCCSWLTHAEMNRRILEGVANQQNTNACYAFAIITAIAGAEGVESNRYSAQELLDNLHIFFPPSCEIPDNIPDEGLANNFENGFAYAKSHGVYLEEDYKWVGRFQREQPNNLPSNPEKIYITDYKTIADGNYKLIVEQLKKQPLAGVIIITNTFLSWGFEDQIYDGPSKEEIEEMKNEMEEARKKGLAYPTRYHAVTIVGFGGDEGSNGYYLCQNSYGPSWGHYGYFKVRRDAVSYVCYPVGVYKARKNINGVQTTHQDSEDDDPMEINDDIEVVMALVDMEIDITWSIDDPMKIEVVGPVAMESDEVEMEIN